MNILQGINLARHFGTTVLFEGVDITVQKGARVALVGRNGAGKSTLLKLLTREELPDIGEVTVAKGVSIGYLSQQVQAFGNHTVWREMEQIFDDFIKKTQQLEQLAERISDVADANHELYLQQYDRLQQEIDERGQYGYASEIRAVLSGFGFPPEMHELSVQQLSGGQKTRLSLAKLLLEKHDLLILDEPTNHLDIATLTWLENYLKQYAGALLIVSHDRYFLDSLVNEVYDLSHQECSHYVGNYTRYLEERARRYEQQLKVYEKQQQDIARLEDFIARNIARASTTKRAQSRRKQLEKMTRIAPPKQDERSARFQFVSERESGQVVLAVEQAAVGYHNQILTGPIDLQLRKQQAVAIVGPNGVGKTTLLKTIVKQLPLISGEIRYGANVDIGYYDQQLNDLTPTQSVLEELWQTQPLTNEKTIRTILGSFLFTKDDVDKPVSALSGGERARLSLAKLAMAKNNFLIFDEPTNHLDIDSKEVLEEALINFDGTILFVSHDRYFINRLATSVLELRPEGSTLYLGDYDYYIEKKQEEALLQAANDDAVAADATITKQATQAQIGYQQGKEAQRQARQRERRVVQLETTLEQLDAEIQAVQANMLEAAEANDYVALATLQEKLTVLEGQQEEIFGEWAALSE